MHKRVSSFSTLQRVSTVLEEHAHRGSVLDILTLTKEAVGLIGDSTGMSEILG